MPYITDDVSAKNIIGLAAQYVCSQCPSDCLLPGRQSVVQPSLLVRANDAFEHASEALSGIRIIRSNGLDRQSIFAHISSPDFDAQPIRRARYRAAHQRVRQEIGCWAWRFTVTMYAFQPFSHLFRVLEKQ